jgi:hypothetical protein
MKTKKEKKMPKQKKPNLGELLRKKLGLKPTLNQLLMKRLRG